MTRRLLAALVLLPALAGADDVFTRGGGKLTGDIVERRPGSVVVDVGGGTIELPLAFIERIVAGPSPIAVYRERAAALAPDDAAGWVALGHWARGQELRTQAEEAFQHVLAQDPQHASAHEALGHVELAGRWVTRDEANRANGLVRFEGEWMTADEQRVLVEERRAAAEQVRLEAAAVTRQRESEARAREAEAQARIAEAAARVAEAKAKHAESAARSPWMPIPLGLAPVTFAGAPGFLTGCRQGVHFGPCWGFIRVPGTGGTFVVARETRPVVRRTR